MIFYYLIHKVLIPNLIHFSKKKYLANILKAMSLNVPQINKFKKNSLISSNKQKSYWKSDDILLKATLVYNVLIPNLIHFPEEK